MTGELTIYVLPTGATGAGQRLEPPRALLLSGHEEGEPITAAQVEAVAVYSRDDAQWHVGGLPVGPELSAEITAHARDLGIEW